MELFRYTGSLTTPPFTGAVKGINFAQPLEMSGGQIQAFREWEKAAVVHHKANGSANFRGWALQLQAK
jgi:carbonic anhydrase